MLGSVRGVVSNDHSYRDKANPRVPTLFRARKATRFGRTIARSERPGVVEEPGMCRSSLDGNREIPRLASRGAPLWPASGRRGAVADDEQTWEVRLRNSSREADEQSRATGCGVGGAKGGGGGECEPAKHGPGTVPGNRVTGAEAHTEFRENITPRRYIPEVGAVCLNWARTDLCGGREVTRVPTAINICSQRGFRLLIQS